MSSKTHEASARIDLRIQKSTPSDERRMASAAAKLLNGAVASVNPSGASGSAVVAGAKEADVSGDEKEKEVEEDMVVAGQARCKGVHSWARAGGRGQECNGGPCAVQCAMCCRTTQSASETLFASRAPPTRLWPHVTSELLNMDALWRHLQDQGEDIHLYK